LFIVFLPLRSGKRFRARRIEIQDFSPAVGTKFNPAKRTLRRVPQQAQKAIHAALHAMCLDPYSGDTKLLKGTNGAFRRREGDWRILRSSH
jgi:hypothetical protein